MARYVAKYQKYAIQARPQKEIVTIDGHAMVAQEQVVLEFQQGAVQAHEIDAAQAHFRHLGVPEGLDPIYRLSAFDTQWAAKDFHWNDETREFVEGFLDSSVSNGVDFIKVEAPRAPAPWPNYDRVKDIKKLLAKVEEDGYEIDAVVAYERENQNRAEVIELLETLAATTNDTDDDEVVA